MIPVDQDKFGPVEGNCFSACVASLLGIPLADVPQFMVGDDWWAGFVAWCAPRGLVARYWASKPVCGCLGEPFLGIPTGYSIMSGESPRHKGVLHAVVALDGAMVHDPHPSRAGVRGERDDHDFITIEKITVAP